MTLNINELAKLYESEEYKKLLDLLAGQLKDANLLSLRGITKKALGQIESAINDLELSVKVRPNDTDLLTNLGNAYREGGKLSKSEEAYVKALEANPDNSNAHDALGLLLFDTGDSVRAATHFKRCIDLDPKNKKAWFQLGEAYRKIDSLREAMNCYAQTDYHLSKANLLDCFYRLGDADSPEAFKAKLEESDLSLHRNALSGSIVTHAERYFQQQINNPFCDDPISLVATGIVKESELSKSDLDSLVEYIDSEQSEYRKQALLVNGKQSSGNIFSLNHKPIIKLKSVIYDYIDKYRAKMIPESPFRAHWPEKAYLYGWVVDMKTNGHLNPHIHKEGWVSGCLYLDMPEKKGRSEGAICFCVDNKSYPNLHEADKIKTVPTQTKMICMFPSSLHHYTNQFTGSGRRLSLAFDLIPK